MAARTLAEFAKRTVIDTLFFRDIPAQNSAGSDCSSSWEDQDDNTHLKPPPASSFTASLIVDDSGRCETSCPGSPVVIIDSPLSTRSSITTDATLDGNLSAKTSADTLSKLDVKRCSFSEPRWTDEYTVRENDTLVSIAANFDIIPTMLKKINRLTADYVYPGQVLRVPPSPQKGSSPCLSGVSIAGSVVLQNEQAGAGHSSTKPQVNERCNLLPNTGTDSGIDRRGSPGTTSVTESDAKSSATGSCQFVKLNAKYITDCDGTVSGTLLVTPNAIMFDPNLLDRFVIEYGAELYGVMVPMDMVMVATIYQDAEAMSYEREHKENPTIPRPEVYHGEAVTDNSVRCAPALVASGSKGDTLPLSTSSAEACPAARNLAALLPPGPRGFSAAAKEVSGYDEAPPTIACNNYGVESMLLSSSYDQPMLPTTRVRAVTPPVTAGPGGSGSHEGYQSDSVVFGLTEEIECGGEDQIPVDSPLLSRMAASSLVHVTRQSSVGGPALTTAAQADLSEPSERQGLPIPQVLPRRHSGPWSSDISAAASAASFFTPPGLQTFVDYASGLFAPSESKSNSIRHGAFTPDMPALRSSDVVPDVSADTHKLHENTCASSTCRFKNEVCDRSDIFQVVDELLVRQSDGKLASTKPLYLCLKVGVPVNKGPVHTSHPIDSYSQQQKPVYWFSIPSDKAPALYSFFVQWTADVYGAGDFDPAERGFIAISEESPSVREETFRIGHPKHNRKLVRQLTKDWEIISISELRIRQTLADAETNLPLPTMDTQSAIITDDHLRELVGVLPLRLDGHALHLAFGTEQHGFSLSKMYRNMQDVDSPILLLIQDTDDHVFGAFLSTAFNITEHFCGTGESFLFTFVGGFKVYTWTGENSLFCRGCLDNLWIGSGEGTFGLYLDGDIYRGRTQHCKTYNNQPLTGGPEEFVVNRMEAWYFYE